MTSQKKILLVDDDHLFCQTIKTVLLPRKYKIISASSCKSGIHKAFKHDPDFIFYNTNLDPLDGSEVFKALQSTTNFNQTPIIFYKDKNEEQIKNIIYNNGSQILSKAQKPNRNQLLMGNNGKVLKNNHQELPYDFYTLFHLSPYGMLIFDKKSILAVNQMLVNLIKPGKQETSVFKMDDIFDKTSLQGIKLWIKDYLKNGTTEFNQQVFFKDRTGESVVMNLRIAELKKIEDSVHFLGTFQDVEGTSPMHNYQLAQKLSDLLKMENMEVSEALEKKIIQTIQSHAINETPPKKAFFTRRENEVLRLSMEGLSIKIIADQLSLSTRTVEKYRTKLMLKSGAKNIVEVIVFSIKNNLLKI